jgi:hypothetical protein
MYRISIVLVTACAALAASCSSIEPKRITAKNDESAVGLRYYETRPFLVVRKPYPISSTPYLVQGVLSNDGKSFFVTHANDDLKLPVWSELKIGQTISPSGRGTGTNTTPQAQGDAGDDGAADGDGDDKPEDKPEAGDSSSACEKGAKSTSKKSDGSASESNETTTVDCKDTSGQRLGFSSISLETDLTGTAIVPINELFSIIYLPDFDREFYIESKARWGLSKLHVTRGPGGTLLAYNSEVDNSAVIKPLFDAWGALVSAATKAAVVKIEPKAQGERVDGAKTRALTPQGVATTLRIHLVKFAVPGAYPFIKPDEVSKWPSSAATRMLVPSAPYQVPYDYFTVLIAEHLLDPPGTSALVNNVTSEVGSEESVTGGDGGQSARGGAGAPVNCKLAHGLPSISYAAANANLALPSDEADPGLRGSIVELKAEPGDPPACAKTLRIKFSGDAGRKEKIEAALKRAFPKVELDVSPQ